MFSLYLRRDLVVKSRRAQKCAALVPRGPHAPSERANPKIAVGITTQGGTRIRPKVPLASGHSVADIARSGEFDKIRTITRRAYGFHNATNLIAFIFLCCTGLVLRPVCKTPVSHPLEC